MKYWKSNKGLKKELNPNSEWLPALVLFPFYDSDVACRNYFNLNVNQKKKSAMGSSN